MLGKKDLNVSSGEGSVVSQAGRDSTIIVGLSYSEARQLFMDLAENHFAELASEARKIADERAREIVEKMLEAFASQQMKISAASDPDFQFSCSLVQREYMRTGDKDLGDLLVSVLAERSMQEQRGQRQIVFNEALITLPKLTKNQVDILAFCCIFKRLKVLEKKDVKRFFQILSSAVAPYVNGFKKIESNYSHLIYVGCVAVNVSRGVLADSLVREYPELFKIKNNKNYPYASDEEIKQLEVLFNKYAPNLVEAGILSEQGSLLASISLTSVGFAIGHAQLKKHGTQLPSINEMISD